MASLTARKRSKLRKTQFASPKGSGTDRSKNQYPVHDRAHAINAKARATQAMKRGRISKSQRNKIVAKANKVLKRKRRRRTRR